METWDDNEFPFGYLITFRTYGTWLHGDERGSIDRYHNRFRGPRVPSNTVLQNQQSTKLKSEPILLDLDQRTIVEKAIRGVCDYRRWRLMAINVRTNHVHIVVATGNVSPDKVLRDFKAYATRALRDQGLWRFGHGPWVDGGSNRYLWKQTDVENACDYVTNQQGPNLSKS